MKLKIVGRIGDLIVVSSQKMNKYNIKGYAFYLQLRDKLNSPKQPVNKKGNKFSKWTKDGKLEYKIGTGKPIKIPAEVIMSAYNLKSFQNRNGKKGTDRKINIAWLYLNGHNHGCSKSVLEFLISEYG